MKLIEKLCKEAWDRHVNKREHFPVYEAFFRDGFEAGFRKARELAAATVQQPIPEGRYLPTHIRNELGEEEV